jgi:hypothetical protein
MPSSGSWPIWKTTASAAPKRERDEEDESDTDWTHIVTQKKEEALGPPAPAATRSIFDDIDK